MAMPGLVRFTKQGQQPETQHHIAGLHTAESKRLYARMYTQLNGIDRLGSELVLSSKKEKALTA